MRYYLFAKKTFLTSWLLLTMLMLGATAAAQHLSLRNNLCYDGALTPNLGFDVALSDRWSLGMNAGFRPWPSDDNVEKKWRHLLLAPELRRWSADQRLLRLAQGDSLYRSRMGYWGLNLVYSHYNVGGVKFPLGLYKSVRDHRLQGDMAALGVFYGYTWRLSRLLRLEAELGLAVGYAWAKKYDCPHCGTYYGRDDKPFLLPKLALNVVFDPQKRRQQPQTIYVVPIDTTPVVPPAPPVLLTSPVLPATTADLLLADNPVLAEYKDYRPYDNTRILRKEKDALFVHFALGGATLQHDFRDNARTLDRIVDITRQIMADTASNVRLIQIIGLASIEGSVKSNELLAANRATALKEYIQQRVSTPDSIYELANGGEAWTELRDQLSDALSGGEARQADDSQAANLRAALDIIDTEQDLTRREQRLRRLNGGKTYAYIRNELLPQQRNSGYLRIYFDRVPDKRAAIINEASELLQSDCGECHAKALQLLQQVADDERAQNALGVALYLNGRHQEALEHFRRAAANGNADARKNLMQIEN